MERVQASRLYRWLLCGCALAQLSACDEAASGGGEPEAASSPDGEPPSVADGCVTAVAGGGFASVPLQPANALLLVELEAQATALDVDGVIGISRGTATRFEQIVAAVRFSRRGVLDVRDGASYRADQAFPFTPGQPYSIRLIADVASRTYSVYVQDPATGDVVRLARGYAFRAPKGGVVSVDTLAVIADGKSGEVSACDVGSAAPSAVVYSREGSCAVAPLPNDQALVSDGATTWKLGASGQVLGQVRSGGEVAADEAGNAYVAHASGGQLALHAYTARLGTRWRRVYPVEPDAGVQAIAADAAGVTIALGIAGGVTSIRRYPASGGPGEQVHGAAARAALARDGFAVARTWQGGVAISLHDRDGTVRWSRSFDNDVTAEVMTLGLDGRVVLGGHFWAPITFGGPTLELGGDVYNVNSFVVALARADGAHVFTTRIDTTHLTGAGASGGRLVIGGERWVTPIFPHLWLLDGAGDLLPGEPYVGFSEQWGRSGRVEVGASGRIYWERLMVWPGPSWPDSPAFPYLLAIRP